MYQGKNLAIGLLASPGEIKIRITVTAKEEREAQAMIQCTRGLPATCPLVPRNGRRVASSGPPSSQAE